MTIEEAKNSDSEEDTFGPNHQNAAGRVKLNNTLSGDNNKNNKRESNGLGGGLIKKVRGGSLNPDDNSSLENSGFKKQTPISDRSDKPGGFGFHKILNQNANNGNGGF